MEIALALKDKFARMVFVLLVANLGYVAFLMSRTDKSWTSPTTRAFLMKSMDEFCADLIGTPMCGSRREIVRTFATNTAMFTRAWAPTLTTVDAILVNHGWLRVESSDYRGTTYCKASYSASYEAADDGTVFVSFASGMKPCRALRRDGSRSEQ
jgi:hypothetical protein